MRKPKGLAARHQPALAEPARPGRAGRSSTQVGQSPSQLGHCRATADAGLLRQPNHANVNANYADEQWFSPFNDKNGNGQLRQGAYAKVDTSLSWRGDALTLRLWGNNLTDKEYYSYGLDLRDSFGFDFLIPAAPRTFGVSARYTF